MLVKSELHLHGVGILFAIQSACLSPMGASIKPTLLLHYSAFSIISLSLSTEVVTERQRNLDKCLSKIGKNTQH